MLYRLKLLKDDNTGEKQRRKNTFISNMFETLIALEINYEHDNDDDFIDLLHCDVNEDGFQVMIMTKLPRNY